MKIAITGSEGKIGSRLMKLGCEPLLCDITIEKEVERELHRVRPDVVLHLAAMTSLEWCEEHYAEALAVNVRGTAIVCEMAEKVIGEGRVALISSDQVFNGKKGSYKEEDDPDPINNYGITKFGAEGVAQLYGDKIIRISRCFDSKSKDILEYLAKLENNEEIFVPNFILRSYCHLDFMADSFMKYAEIFDKAPEILHIAGRNAFSFFELVLRIADLRGYDVDLVNERSVEEVGHAPRPYLTGLNVSRSIELGIPIARPAQSIEKVLYERP